jgi:hypothetical protein
VTYSRPPHRRHRTGANTCYVAKFGLQVVKKMVQNAPIGEAPWNYMRGAPCSRIRPSTWTCPPWTAELLIIVIAITEVPFGSGDFYVTSIAGSIGPRHFRFRTFLSYSCGSTSTSFVSYLRFILGDLFFDLLWREYLPLILITL